MTGSDPHGTERAVSLMANDLLALFTLVWVGKRTREADHQFRGKRQKQN